MTLDEEFGSRTNGDFNKIVDPKLGTRLMNNYKNQSELIFSPGANGQRFNQNHHKSSQRASEKKDTRMANKNRYYMSTYDSTAPASGVKDPKTASKVLLKAKQREENARQFQRQNSQGKLIKKVGLTKSIVNSGNGNGQSGKRLVREEYHKI